METPMLKASCLQEKCLQENLSKGLALVARAVASRSTLPVLSNILITAEPDNTIRLSATNLEIGITARLGAKVEQAGAITIPARLLLELANSFPAERVDLALDGATLNVRCGRLESNLKGIPAEEFPVVPAYAGGGFTLPAEELRGMIDRVVFSAAKDEARPILTGVLVKLTEDRISLAAADGFRLSVANQNGQTGLEPGEVIIPARALIELSKIIKDAETVTVVIQAERRQVMFHTENVDLTSQLIHGNFPDFSQIIPKSHSTRTVLDRAGLLQAVKVSHLFARDSANIVKLEIRPGADELQGGKVTLVVVSAELGDNVAELDAAIEGPELDIAFNTVYLREALEAAEAASVALETTVASSPGVIRAVGDEGWLSVLMPMHISK